MRLSVSLTNYSWREVPLVDGLVRAAVTADQGGLDTVWVPDHLAQVDPTVPAEADDMLEAYSVLAYLASRTERVRLGALVTNVALRPPALLANAVATLDTLSGGRAWLGIGAGYDTSETPDLGLPTLPTGERFELLEETVQVVTQMFAGDATPITGAHVRLDRPFLRPRPVKGIPLLIGARRRGPDRARPRRTALGRAGGPRAGLPGRGRLLTQRSHPCNVHPHQSLIPGAEHHLLGAASGPTTVASGPSSAPRPPSDRRPGPGRRGSTVAAALEQLTLRIRRKEARCRA